MTSLQVFQLAVRDVLLDARDTLDDDSYRALLATAQAFLTAEHVRVAAGDVERFKRTL